MFVLLVTSANLAKLLLKLLYSSLVTISICGDLLSQVVEVRPIRVVHHFDVFR